VSEVALDHRRQQQPAQVQDGSEIDVDHGVDRVCGRATASVNAAVSVTSTVSGVMPVRPATSSRRSAFAGNTVDGEAALGERLGDGCAHSGVGAGNQGGAVERRDSTQ